ncbi:hypothetical protein F504_2557 [Ralstonia pseudosolanacearum FQY_4]|nr:hypothetical protein F504_2557 [Ralstonia pseudosolanacearum FQY_4]
MDAGGHRSRIDRPRGMWHARPGAGTAMRGSGDKRGAGP